MKKILISFLTIFSFAWAEIGDYKSDFGVGVGMGFPSGYEIKGIYRANDWISLSLNYNLFQIKGFSENIDNDDNNLNITGDLVFSNPGIILNYHPFGGNLRLMAGILYDLGGLEVNADGNMDVDYNGTVIDTPVTGHVKVKLGTTYPYLGVAYGYNYESVIHIEASLGVYLIKTPEVDLYFATSETAVDKILDEIGTLSVAQKSEIKKELSASGGNLLNLPSIVADVANITGLTLPSEQSLEDDIASLIHGSESPLPQVFGYSLLPVISIGFTFFPF